MTDLAHVDLMFHYVYGIFYLFPLGLALGEWLLLNANWDVVRFILDQQAEVDFYGEVHKRTVHGLFHSDALFWFRTNKSLPLPLSTAFLVEKQHTTTTTVYLSWVPGFIPGFRWVLVTHIFSFLCCVFCFVCLHPMLCVASVCWYLWSVHSRLPLPFSSMFIYIPWF